MNFSCIYNLVGFWSTRTGRSIYTKNSRIGKDIKIKLQMKSIKERKKTRTWWGMNRRKEKPNGVRVLGFEEGRIYRRSVDIYYNIKFWSNVTIRTEHPRGRARGSLSLPRRLRLCFETKKGGWLLIANNYPNNSNSKHGNAFSFSFFNFMVIVMIWILDVFGTRLLAINIYIF